MKISNDNRAFFQFVAELLLGLAFVSAVIVWINQTECFESREKTSPVTQMWGDFHESATLPEFQRPNLFFLGSSRAKYLNPAIIEEETEYRPQFIGLGGANIRDLYFAFQYVLKSHVPQMVLVETHSLVEVGNEGRKDLSQRAAIWAVDDFKFRKNIITTYYGPKKWPVFLAGSALLNRELIETSPARIYNSILKRFPEPTPTVRGFQISGYTPITEERLASYANGWVAGDLRDWVMPVVEIDFLAKLVELCRDHSIIVVLYESPIYGDHMAGRGIRTHRLAALANSLQAPFFDLNSETDITKEPNYFEDTDRENQHLTKEGYQVLTHKIVDKILRFLPAHQRVTNQ